MTTKHKHADVLIAIAEGREVQFQTSDGKWHDTKHPNPLLNHETEWRVKPVPKEPEYCYINQEADVMWFTINKEKTTTHRIKLEPLDDN